MADLWRQRLQPDLAVAVTDQLAVELIAGRQRRIRVNPGELRDVLDVAGGVVSRSAGPPDEVPPDAGL